MDYTYCRTYIDGRRTYCTRILMIILVYDGLHPNNVLIMKQAVSEYTGRMWMKI